MGAAILSYDSTQLAESTLKEQTAWVATCERGMEHHRRRAEHVLSMLQREQVAEAQRSIEALRPMSAGTKRAMDIRNFKARTEASDRLIRVLHEYRWIGSADLAEYLLGVRPVSCVARSCCFPTHR